LEQAMAVDNTDRSTSPHQRSSTPEMPPTSFKKDLPLNTSTWSSTDSTEEYDLHVIADKLDDVFKHCSKVEMLRVYADMIDFIIYAKTNTCQP